VSQQSALFFLYMDEPFVNIKKFMVSELKLSGTDLIIYAIINGFSKDGGLFHGGVSYLIEWTNTSKNTVLSSLKYLCKHGLITKHQTVIKGVTYANYKTTKSRIAPVQKLHKGSAKTAPGVVQELHWGGAEIAPNKKEHNKVQKKVEEKEKFDDAKVLKSQKKSNYYQDAFEDISWQESTALLLKVHDIKKFKYLYSCFYCYQKTVGKKHDSLIDLKKNFMSWAKPELIEEKMKEFKSGKDISDSVYLFVNNNNDNFLGNIKDLTVKEVSDKMHGYVYNKYNSIEMALFIQNPVQVFKKEFHDFLVNNKVPQTI